SSFESVTVRTRMVERPATLATTTTATTATTTMSRRTIDVWVALIVAVLVVVPPLVRARQSLAPRPSSTTIRLNPGFDTTERKCWVGSPDVTEVSTSAPDPPALVVAAPTRPEVFVPPVHDYDTPYVLRGPPAFSLDF